jgi:trans-2,3-dihydro-3-hydroxyanthranilate isomerase
MATFRYVFTDVFTDVALAGNQLAVFTDAREIPDELLQPIAREINFSETVFVYPGTGEGDARIRIFTPGSELPFAGHPILGTAFVLAGPLQLEEIRLETRAGVVPVRLERDGSRIAFGWMRQPVPSIELLPHADELLAVLGVTSELPVEQYDLGPQHAMIALASEAEVAALRPDFGRLAEAADHCVSCFAGSGRNWKLRMFAPRFGVNEDPATGSAAGPLALHLARHGWTNWGDEIVISQGAEIGRPSTLHAVARSETEIEVGGSAVVVARGEFRL